VTSVLVLGAPITALLDSIARGAVPPPTVLGGYVLVTVAVTLVIAGLLWPTRRTQALAA
jgi:hypothetical protein